MNIQSRPRVVTVTANQANSGRQQTIKGRPDKKKQSTQGNGVSYGSSWYEQTRQATKRSAKEEIEYRRKANREANNGIDRKDLYTDNWDGSEYKGSNFNILTVIAAISVIVPIIGLIFAYQTYGTLWG